MPVQRCREGGKSGWRWGKRGKCYTYARGDKRAAGEAYKKALAQGEAMGERVRRGG